MQNIASLQFIGTKRYVFLDKFKTVWYGFPGSIYWSNVDAMSMDHFKDFTRTLGNQSFF